MAFVLCRVAVDQLGVARPPSLVDGLLSWDAHHYLAIADHGYGAVTDGYRFFPLFPLLVHALGILLLGRSDIAAVVLANGCALALGVALYRLTLHETGNVRAARLTTWVVLLSPAAAGAPLPTASALGLAVLAGLLGNLGIQLLARAYAAAEAQSLGVLEFTALPWAALFGWLFFDEAVRPQVWVGAAVIFGACWWVGRAERQRARDGPALP